MITSHFTLCGCIAVGIVLAGCSPTQNPAQVASDHYASEANLNNDASLVCNPEYLLNTPSMAASTFYDHVGNIEIVRLTRPALYKTKADPVEDKMEHLWWNPTRETWSRSTTFGDFPTESNCNPSLCINADDHRLQVVTREMGKLAFYWRDLDGQWYRQGEIPDLGGGFIGSPVMICNNLVAQSGDLHDLDVIVKGDFAARRFRWFKRDKNYVWREIDKSVNPNDLEFELNLPEGEYVRSDPAMAQCLNGDIHLVFVTNTNILAHYIYRNYAWFRRDDESHRITGIDNQTRPGIVAYGYSQVQVFVRPQDDVSILKTYYNRNNMYLVQDELTVQCGDGNQLVTNPAAVTLGTYEPGSATQYVHFYYNENGPNAKCVHKKVRANPR